MSRISTISKARDQVLEGRAKSVLAQCYAQIDRYEPDVQAWVSVDHECEEGAPPPDGLGPRLLEGIPIGIKDIIDVRGTPTKAGTEVRTQISPAQLDAPLVRNLRNQGAIILGKTVTTEFACFDPAKTCNPWNLQHTPGGSSSGSAAAVVTGMCLGAIGTQTGGSIIRPASYCGVVGLKPSYGRISMDGVVPVSTRLDHAGPMAIDVLGVTHLWLALQNSQLSTTAEGCPTDLLSHVDQPAQLHPPKLGFLKGLFLERAEAQVQKVFQQCRQTLITRGVKPCEIGLPSEFQRLHEMHYRIMVREAAEVHRDDYPEHRESYGKSITSVIEAGLATTDDQYDEACGYQDEMKQLVTSLFAEANILCTPSTNTTAPASRDTTGDPLFNVPWSLTGLPAVTILCGLAENGMPCGLQLIGRHGAESELLTAAAWCEFVLGESTKLP